MDHGNLAVANLEQQRQAGVDLPKNDLDGKTKSLLVVEQDDENDPENILNWDRARKGVCLCILSLSAFTSPLSATYNECAAVRYQSFPKLNLSPTSGFP